MKILIVDDHPIVLAGLRRLLAGDGRHEMREAAEGKEALGIARQYRPDLVILDLNLPGLGGLELIKRLRIDDPETRIPVLSMHDDAIFARRALQAGALGYISKNAPLSHSSSRNWIGTCAVPAIGVPPRVAGLKRQSCTAASAA